MQAALNKRRNRRTISGITSDVGGLIKFTPPAYTQREASSIHGHEAVTGCAANQPLIIISEHLDEEGCVLVLKVISIGKNRLARLIARHPSFSDRLIPIESSDPRLGNGAGLRVAPGTRKRLPPIPHVDVAESTLVSFGALRDYNGSRSGREQLSLTAESYVRLAGIWAGSEAAKASRGRHAGGRRWGTALTVLLASLLLFWTACVALFFFVSR